MRVWPGRLSGKSTRLRCHAGQNFIVDYIVEDEQRAGVVMAATSK